MYICHFKILGTRKTLTRNGQKVAERLLKNIEKEKETWQREPKKTHTRQKITEQQQQKCNNSNE